MPRLEEITYEAGRHALADQESVVAGIRQRAGTLLAAHALVASFLGANALDELRRPAGLVWLALAALVSGLVVATILLAPWRIEFALDAEVVYGESRGAASEGSDSEDLTWLISVGLLYEQLRENNTRMVNWMTRLSIVLSALVVVHAVLWTTVLIEGTVIE